MSTKQSNRFSVFCVLYLCSSFKRRHFHQALRKDTQFKQNIECSQSHVRNRFVCTLNFTESSAIHFNEAPHS